MAKDGKPTVVLAIDLSEMTDPVLDAARAIVSGGGEVHAVCVIDTPVDPRGGKSTSGGELEGLEEAVEARIGGSFAGGGLHVHARGGNPAEEIARLAAEVRADQIVVGRHGHSGPREHIVGSVPSRLLQLARCSVLVVQPADYS